MGEQIKCGLCGAEASEGENQHHAETLAKAEGFEQRPGRWMCPNCSGVKQMRTTDVESYKKKNIEKV